MWIWNLQFVVLVCDRIYLCMVASWDSIEPVRFGVCDMFAGCEGWLIVGGLLVDMWFCCPKYVLVCALTFVLLCCVWSIEFLRFIGEISSLSRWLCRDQEWHMWLSMSYMLSRLTMTMYYVFCDWFLWWGGQWIECRVPHIVCLVAHGVFMQYEDHYMDYILPSQQCVPMLCLYDGLRNQLCTCNVVG
jgi:hypothetical protein